MKKKVKLQVWIDVQMSDNLNKIVSNTELTKSQLVRKLIIKYLEGKK